MNTFCTTKIFAFLLNMFAQNFTTLPQSHFELIQLGIIADIFCKTMKCLYQCIKKYEYIHVHLIFSNFIFLCVYRIWPFCPKYHIKHLFRFGSMAYFSLFLHRIWLFPPKNSNVGTLLLCIIAIICPKFDNFRPFQLGIIDYIFGKFMNQHCAKFYTNTRTNMDIIYDNAVHFCDFCMKFEYFAPKV